MLFHEGTKLMKSRDRALPRVSSTPELSPIGTTLLDCLLKVRSSTPPSCLRGDLVKVPDLSYSDVIGYEDVKSKLDQVLALTNGDVRERFNRFGIRGSMGGVLLYGPPGGVAYNPLSYIQR